MEYTLVTDTSVPQSSEPGPSISALRLTISDGAIDTDDTHDESADVADGNYDSTLKGCYGHV